MPGKFDVAIIGGGVVGRAIARELSRYQIRVAVLRYVLPAKISGEAAVDFTMRPWKEEHGKAVVFRSGGEVLRRLKMPHMEPAGMIRVRVGQGRFGHVVDNEITVSVEVAE